jgi:hypothetical protein
MTEQRWRIELLTERIRDINDVKYHRPDLGYATYGPPNAEIGAMLKRRSTNSRPATSTLPSGCCSRSRSR